MLNLTKCPMVTETFSLDKIHRGVNKDWLKFELGNCGKASFFNLAFTVFSFQIALKI